MTDNSRKALGILSKVLFIVIAITIVHFLLSLVGMIIGAVYLGQCTIQSNIPVYLIVIGIVFIVLYLSIVPYMIMFCGKGIEQIFKSTSALIILIVMAVLSLFGIAWNITGAVWVFGVKPNVQSSDPTLSTYCHSTPYYYAFAYCIITFVLCISSSIGSPVMSCCYKTK